MSYTIPDLHQWHGRIDTEDGELGHRWHQIVEALNLEEASDLKEGNQRFAFLGFRSDEGVKRNKGRIGALKGPETLRRVMSSTAVHFDEQKVKLLEAGDVSCVNHKMEEAQEELGKRVKQLLERKTLPIVLGGGHEISFGHYLGLHNWVKKHHPGKKIGIVNFDAHFDLRVPSPEPSSGTPFNQISQLCEKDDTSFLYQVMGINPAANTRKLFQIAEELKVHHVPYYEMHISHIHELAHALHKFINRCDFIYMTIDMDVFSAPFAPGVSALNSCGTFPEVISAMIRRVAKSGKLLSMDIAELNPKFDIDDRTAKLASHLIYELINAKCE
ncbi:formimidoylglutamase [Persicobacter sp. CCB-QB2]|uniref:formimidoylglutamase n=1 Tax=Persicobacter sp. CCB-QB2 TaxID=1561025 RepID=UPI0006A9CDCE|nr:formimidoylglutamase [Persicobacter sp. CCB-QB2]